MLRDQRGMTLVEVMVAVLIFSFCLVPVCTGLLVGKQRVEEAENKVVALELAQGKLEETINKNFDDIAGIPETVFNAPYTGYSYIVGVEKDADYPETLKIITVTVYYTGAGSATPKSVALVGARAGR